MTFMTLPSQLPSSALSAHISPSICSVLCSTSHLLFLLNPQQFIRPMTQTANDQWKTSNQDYGNNSSALLSTSLRQKMATSTLDQLKQGDTNNFIHQQENIAQRWRHGLFTQPLGISVGDQYHDAKPPEVAKNITVNPRLKDKVAPELFSKLGSTNIGDPYKDKYKEKQLYEMDKSSLNPHGRAFVPSHNGKKIKHSEFEHLQEFPHKTYDTRDDFGNVKSSKRNFSTNPMKRGTGASNTGHLFKEYPYLSTPYDSEQEHNKRDRLAHKARISQPFVGASHTNSVFTPDYHTLRGKDKSTPHFGPWKNANLAKKGYNSTFQNFPQYIEEGEKQRQPAKHENPWIHNYNGTSKNIGETLSKPCPVPSQMVLNELRGR